MRLTELDARFASEPGRHGQGLVFECPLCVKEGRPAIERALVHVSFTNPIDGGASLKERVLWDRDGETLETLTLEPSLDASDQDHRTHKGWHGCIRRGALTNV